MMMKKRERWLPALILALIIHLILIAIVYMNYGHKTHDTAPMTASISPNDASQVASGDQASMEPTVGSDATQSSTSALKTQMSESLKTVPTVHSENSNHLNADTTHSPNNATTSNEAVTPTKNPKTEAQDNLTKPSETISAPAAQALDESGNPLTTPSAHPILLDVDVPRTESTLTHDRQFNQSKEETEALNDKLSAAITEIKNRNQQKINQQRQPYVPSTPTTDTLPTNQNTVLTQNDDSKDMPPSSDSSKLTRADTSPQS